MLHFAFNVSKILIIVYGKVFGVYQLFAYKNDLIHLKYLIASHSHWSIASLITMQVTGIVTAATLVRNIFAK